jgi:tetratricopeptide (TPR) repeat protein
MVLHPTKDRFRGALMTLSLIAAGFLVYANSLGGAFVYDDEPLVKDNVTLTSVSYVGEIFRNNILAGAGQQSVFYRPLQMLTLWADHAVWKFNPFGYHLTSVIWHILAGLVLFWFLRMLLGLDVLAFFAALLFEIHPIHTEAVSYISGRADPMAFVFLLTTFILYLKQAAAPRKSTYFLMLLAYSAALLSRENSMILPALIGITHVSFKQKVRRKEFFSLCALLCFYLFLRIIVLKGMLSEISSDTSLFQRAPGFFVALLQYIRLLFLPLGLHMEYGTPLFGLTDPRVWLGMIVCGGLLVFMLRKKSVPDLARFSLAWFLVSLLPVSNLFPINAYMAEHWLYLPSVGFFILLAYFLKRLYEDRRHRSVAVGLAAGLVFFYAFLTVRQNTYWKDPETFYTRTLKYAPQSSKVLNNLGSLTKAKGHIDDAISFFQKAIAAKPDNSDAHYNLGNAFLATSRMPDAIASYQRALALNPNRAEIYNNLGNAYMSLGENESALANYQKALARNPHYVDAANNLSIVFSNLGRNQEAVDLLKEVIRRNPRYAVAYKNLAVFYYQTNQINLAIAMADKARDLGAEIPSTFLEALEPFRK